MASKPITDKAVWTAEQGRVEGAAAGSPLFKRIARITLPYLSLGDTDHLYIRVDGFPRIGRIMVGATGQQTTVTLLPVTNLETHHAALFIAPTELVAVLAKVPNPVGKRFEIGRAEDDGISQYREVEVWELE